MVSLVLTIIIIIFLSVVYTFFIVISSFIGLYSSQNKSERDEGPGDSADLSAYSLDALSEVSVVDLSKTTNNK